MHPRIKTALLFALVGAVVGGFIGSQPENVLGMGAGIAIGAICAALAGLFWD